MWVAVEDDLVDAAGEVLVDLGQGLLAREGVRAVEGRAALSRVDRLVPHVHRCGLGTEPFDQVAELEALGLWHVHVQGGRGDLE